MPFKLVDEASNRRSDSRGMHAKPFDFIEKMGVGPSACMMAGWSEFSMFIFRVMFN